jgi:benzoyl-CoA-dihydrodiol lyase
LLGLRFNEEELGLLIVKTEGDLDRVLEVDRTLDRLRDDDWFVREILLYQARVLRRLDLTARSIFARVEPGSCFGGSLLELMLAADRSYMLDMGEEPVIAVSRLNAGQYPMAHGVSRMEAHFSGDAERAARVLETERFSPSEADEAGLVTMALDDIDYEDEVRVAIEERASLSPDALTGMEASLRFPGMENSDCKIFGRLSAWQNWIFFRPNAVGEAGALKVYGKPERPSFDWKRT